MTPVEFLREVERKTNTHRFEEVAPLIADNAIYWFSDGSFHGKAAIKEAFERTWAWIQDEHYAIEGVQWLVDDKPAAVCVYVSLARAGGRTSGAGDRTGNERFSEGEWSVAGDS